MLTIKKILFPTDHSPSAQRAFSHAAFLQEWNDAELHVVNVVIVDDSDRVGAKEEALLTEEDIAEQLHFSVDQKTGEGRSEAAASDPRSKVRQVEVKAFRAADAIVDYVDEQNVDLIVMGTHGRRGVQRVMLGSVTEEVVRRAPCPILTVSAGTDEAPKHAIRRILVPVDFSEHTSSAIQHAVELAQTYGAEIDLLHVFNLQLFATPYGFEFAQESVVQGREQAEKMLADLAENEIGFEHVLATVEVGHPTDRILNYAEENEVDLIVMPTHGRSGLQRVMMGSVAEKVVRMAPCPVFTIKSFGKSLIPVKKDREAEPEA